MGIRLKSVVGALALCALANVSYAADPIKIGVDGPFTGGSSSMGVSMRDGVRLATDEINKAGGVLGRQIVARRTRRRSEERTRRADRAGADQQGEGRGRGRLHQHRRRAGLAALLPGSEDSGDQQRGHRLASSRTSSTTSPRTTSSATPPHDSIQAPMIVEEAITRRGFKKVAILADSTNYGQLGREDLEKALAAKGIKPVAVEKFNIKDVDMTAQLLKAKEAGAEAVLTYGIGPELAQIANGMTKLGWKVPMIGSWTLSMANYIDNAGPNGEGARMPQTFIQEAEHAEAQGLHRQLPEGHSSRRTTASTRRCRPRRATTRSTCWPPRSSRPAATDGPKVRAALEDLKTPGGRRRDDLRQAVHARRPRSDHRRTCRCSARSRAAAWSTRTTPTRRAAASCAASRQLGELS